MIREPAKLCAVMGAALLASMLLRCAVAAQLPRSDASAGQSVRLAASASPAPAGAEAGRGNPHEPR